MGKEKELHHIYLQNIKIFLGFGTSRTYGCNSSHSFNNSKVASTRLPEQNITGIVNLRMSLRLLFTLLESLVSGLLKLSLPADFDNPRPSKFTGTIPRSAVVVKLDERFPRPCLINPSRVSFKRELISGSGVREIATPLIKRVGDLGIPYRHKHSISKTIAA